MEILISSSLLMEPKTLINICDERIFCQNLESPNLSDASHWREGTQKTLSLAKNKVSTANEEVVEFSLNNNLLMRKNYISKTSSTTAKSQPQHAYINSYKKTLGIISNLFNIDTCMQWLSIIRR